MHGIHTTYQQMFFSYVSQISTIKRLPNKYSLKYKRNTWDVHRLWFLHSSSGTQMTTMTIIIIIGKSELKILSYLHNNPFLDTLIIYFPFLYHIQKKLNKACVKYCYMANFHLLLTWLLGRVLTLSENITKPFCTDNNTAATITTNKSFTKALKHYQKQKRSSSFTIFSLYEVLIQFVLCHVVK